MAALPHFPEKDYIIPLKLKPQRFSKLPHTCHFQGKNGPLRILCVLELLFKGYNQLGHPICDGQLKNSIHPSIRLSIIYLSSFHHPSIIHRFIIHISIHHSFIYPLIPPSIHSSTIHLSTHHLSIHPSIHHPSSRHPSIHLSCLSTCLLSCTLSICPPLIHSSISVYHPPHVSLFVYHPSEHSAITCALPT